MKQGFSLSRVLLVLAVLPLFVGSASALSCQTLDMDRVTIHCPREGACQSDIDAVDSERLGTYIEAGEIPEPGNVTYENRTFQDRELKFQFRTQRNSDLPSAEEALDRSSSLCPQESLLHLYPQGSFKEQQLEDTTMCYTIQIEELENYYLVWREGTTEGWNCVEKVKGRRISGGETRYVAPIDVWWVIGKALDLLVPL